MRLNKRQWFPMWALAWVTLAQTSVELLTFGFVIPEWRSRFLFSDWMDRHR